MKLTDAQWVDVWCLLMEAEGQPAEAIATMRAISKQARFSDLKERIHHSLVDARYYPAPIRAKVEELLREHGLPPLSKLDVGYVDDCRRILKRGRIRNDDEFYVVADFLADVDSEFSESERIKLGEMTRAYEARPR